MAEELYVTGFVHHYGIEPQELDLEKAALTRIICFDDAVVFGSLSILPVVSNLAER